MSDSCEGREKLCDIIAKNKNFNELNSNDVANTQSGTANWMRPMHIKVRVEKILEKYINQTTPF